MNSLVIYESMYGNTRQIAEAIAAELPGARAVPVWAVDAAELAELAAADLVIVGGPTHAFGMSRPGTRAQAELAARQKPELTFEAPVTAGGVREWLSHTDLRGKRVAAFDTRVRMPLPHAAARIRAAARRAGATVCGTESFPVTKANTLRPGELERARTWARRLPSVRRGQDVGP